MLREILKNSKEQVRSRKLAPEVVDSFVKTIGDMEETIKEVIEEVGWFCFTFGTSSEDVVFTPIKRYH